MTGVYRSRPTIIEAVRWTGDNYIEVAAFAPGRVDMDETDSLRLRAGVDGAQDWVPVPVGHWVVHQPGDTSDYWPVDDDYFTSKYDFAYLRV